MTAYGLWNALVILCCLLGPVNSQSPGGSPPAAILQGQACYTACDDHFTNITRSYLSPLGLPAYLQFHNGSYSEAADAFCSEITLIINCYSNCSRDNPLVISWTSSQLTSVQGRYSDFCFPSDPANCRFADSLFCDANYAWRSCDNALSSYQDCVVSTQLKRGCTLDKVCYKSQRIVQSQLLAATIYCSTASAKVVTAIAAISDLPTAVALQSCGYVIQAVCLADFFTLSLSTLDLYIGGTVNCSSFITAETCILSTVNSTITLPGRVLSKPCSNLPDHIEAIYDVIHQLRNLSMYSCSGSTCLAASTTAARTSTSPTTSVTTVKMTSTVSPLPSMVQRAQGCYEICDTMYTNFSSSALAASSLQAFLQYYNGSYRMAADEACNEASRIMQCYSNCLSTYPSVLCGSSEYRDLQDISGRFCFSSDAANCRLMDAYYCETNYNWRSCGSELDSYKACVVSTQLERKCPMTQVCFQSQRIVQSQLLTVVKYCAMANDNVTAIESSSSLTGAALQACEPIVQTQCFADFFSSSRSILDLYIGGVLNCSSFSNAESCILRTLNSVIMYKGKAYNSPCSLLPGGASAVNDVISQLRNLTVSACRNDTCPANGTTSSIYVSQSRSATTVPTAPVISTVSNSAKVPVDIKSASACYQMCDSLYDTLWSTALSSSTMAAFFQSHGSNYRLAGDAVCSQVSTIKDCYNKCTSNNPLGGQYSSPQQADTSDLWGRHCFTDSAGTCRLMDSYFCEASYNWRACDSNITQYIQCVESSQSQRNCDISKVCSRGQRIVQAQLLDVVQYCATSSSYVSTQVMNTVDQAKAAALQACEPVIQTKCLGEFFSMSRSILDVYINGPVTCSSFANAEVCVWSTLNTTIIFNGTAYQAPCSLLPNASSGITSVVSRLRQLRGPECSNYSCFTTSTPIVAQSRSSALKMISTHSIAQLFALVSFLVLLPTVHH